MRHISHRLPITRPTRDSELINGGYAGLTQIIVVNGTKKRVLLADTNEPMNVGTEQNPAIQVIDADAVYLITQSNRTFDMGKIEDFAGMTQYAIVDNLFQNTNAVAEKYKDASGKFDYQRCPRASCPKTFRRI